MYVQLKTKTKKKEMWGNKVNIQIESLKCTLLFFKPVSAVLGSLSTTSILKSAFQFP